MPKLTGMFADPVVALTYAGGVGFRYPPRDIAGEDADGSCRPRGRSQFDPLLDAGDLGLASLSGSALCRSCCPPPRR